MVKPPNVLGPPAPEAVILLGGVRWRKELRHVRKVLRQSLEQCREHEQTGRCEVVDELSARAKRP